MFEKFWSARLQIIKREGKDLISTCYSCGGKRFSVNSETGRFNCWSCKKRGNYVTYLKAMHPTWDSMDIRDELDKFGVQREQVSKGKKKSKIFSPLKAQRHQAIVTDEELQAFADSRGFPDIKLLKKYRFGKNEKGEICFPTFAPDGSIRDFRRRTAKGEFSTKGGSLGIFGMENLGEDFIIWCEAPMDAIASEYMGHPAIASCGCGLSYDEFLHLFKGKKMIIAFDNDAPGKEGAQKKKDQLDPIAAQVEILEIPNIQNNKDINDLLKIDGGREVFQAYLDEVKLKFETKIEVIPYKKEPKATRPIPKDPTYSQVADAFLDQYHHKGVLTLRFYRGEFYEFNGVSYKVIDKTRFKARVNKFLKLSEETLPWAGGRPVSYVIENIVAETLLPEYKVAPFWIDTEKEGRYITLKNGVLNIQSKTLEAHTPEFFDLVQLSFEYDPRAICHRWESFLHETHSDKEVREVIQEFFGYCLDANLNLQKCLILEGQGSNGKGVISETLSNLIGKENISAIGLERFGDRFSLHGTLNKLVNIVPDMEQIDKISEGAFKYFVSQDNMSFEKKHCTPFTAKPTAKLMISTNSLPRFRDRSKGVWRRIILVKCLTEITEDQQDDKLHEKLQVELPGIFNWALKGLERLHRVRKFTKSQLINQWGSEYRHEQNPAQMFLKENFEHSPLREEESQIVFDEFREFCANNNFQCLNQSNFGKELLKTFPQVVKTQRRADGKRPYIYVGLGRK